MDDQLRKNREAQAQLYGEPLGDLFRRIADALGLTQARLAETLGLSAPMLSQLMSGHRVKIGNPSVIQRVQALDEFVTELAGGTFTPEQIEQRVAEIRASPRAFTRTTQSTTRPIDARSTVHGIQSVFRAVSSAGEVLEAAALLEQSHPAIAELLRVYGAGRTDEAIAHFERVTS